MADIWWRATDKKNRIIYICDDINNIEKGYYISKPYIIERFELQDYIECQTFLGDWEEHNDLPVRINIETNSGDRLVNALPLCTTHMDIITHMKNSCFPNYSKYISLYFNSKLPKRIYLPETIEFVSIVLHCCIDLDQIIKMIEDVPTSINCIGIFVKHCSGKIFNIGEVANIKKFLDKFEVYKKGIFVAHEVMIFLYSCRWDFYVQRALNSFLYTDCFDFKRAIELMSETIV